MASLIFNFTPDVKDVPKDYVYKDIKFSLKKTKNNFGFKELDDIDAVRNSVKNIFSWIKGQRIIQPEFGCNLRRFLYEPINEITAHNIGSDIKDAFDRWEPRVTLLGIEVIPHEDDNQYNVTVDYTIPSINVNTKYVYDTILSKIV